MTGSEEIQMPLEFSDDFDRVLKAERDYQASGDQIVLDAAIIALKRTLNDPAFAKAPKHFQLVVLSKAAIMFQRNYRVLGHLDDLNQALKFWQQTMAATPPDSPDRLIYLNNLGNVLRDRYIHTSRLEDLEEAIAVYQQAKEATPPDSPVWPAILNNLSNGLSDRYTRTGQLEDLEEAIQMSQQAVAASPSDSPDRAMYLNNLGTCLHARYARVGHLEDLEDAIRVLQQAAVATPPNSQDRPGYLNNWGNGLRDRYIRTGRLEDLEKAIRVYRQAVTIIPPGSPVRPAILTNLGVCLRDRYARTGQLEDLEEAIRMLRQALKVVSSNSLDRASILTNLGTGLSIRYARTGQLEDLEEAIQILRQAVTATPPDSPDRPSRLGNLGLTLLDRYAHSGQLEDLEEAIRMFQEAVTAIPPNSRDWPGHLNNLGTGLRARYARTGELEDLKEAIRVFQQAVEATPSDFLDRPRYLSNLGSSLRARYARTDQLEDLEEAIRTYRQAAADVSPDSPDRPGYLNNLGNGLRDCYARTGHLEDLEEAIRVYEDALVTLEHTLLVSTVVYQLGQQARWAGFYARAVAIHQQAGHLGQALALAEGSKSRLLTTLLGRGDLPMPPGVPAHLIAQEQSLASELAALDAVDLSSHSRFGIVQAETEHLTRLGRRRNLVDQLTSLWQEMIGYGQEATDYVALRRGDRPDWENLQQLTRQLGPQTAILSLFTLADHILLFVLRADQLAPIMMEVTLPVDELHYNYLANYEDEILNRQAYRAAGRPLTHRWRGLGMRLLASILPHLDGVSHLVIVPQGFLHLLPLHALILNKAGETLLDRFAVSYVPAIGLLARLWSRTPLETGAAFVLGYTPANPSTTEGAIERNIFLGEAMAIAAQMKVQPYLDQHADSQQLQAALADKEFHLVHLSCHGGFDPADPLRSGVLLADGLFTARQWMDLRFRADLVTLSACQTALTGSLGGDELVGLSQALLYAGASSLLLGLWSVNAVTTQALMTDFYGRLRDGNGHKRTDEATALREAILALRNGQLLSPRVGFDPSDPYYWAPFILIGDWR